MKHLDQIIFGDNQFFGINHMSQDKALELSEKFKNLEKIIEVYDIAYNLGLKSFMLNSNDKAKDICNYFKENINQYPDISWYPSIPYPHKYANLVSEKGVFPAITEILFDNNSTLNIFSLLKKGSTAFINKDVIKLMQMLIDIEMKMFKGLNVKVIFLQNIITDLLLGLNTPDIFKEYCDYVRTKYNVIPGFITQNLPALKCNFEKWDISGVAICASFNKIGYLMSPDIDTYIKIISENNPDKYHIMAMSTLASGSINPIEAYEFINKHNIQSIVFGASSKKNIEQTLQNISKNNFDL
jgi:hypothetical protein